MRALALVCLCSCTLSHALSHRDDRRAPSVQLSPKMQKRADVEQRAPWWTFAGDMTLAIGGFEAHPIMQSFDRPNETVNIAGLVLCGLVMASLGYTALALDAR